MAATTTRPSVVPPKDLESFQEHLNKSTRILALLGAGLSASSGLPTFRGAGGLWRTHDSTSLATPEAFGRDPGLVWQFYSYRRHMALGVKPNPAHYALAELAKKKNFLTLSQNVDGKYLSKLTSVLQEYQLTTLKASHLAHSIQPISSSFCTALFLTSSAQTSSVITSRRTITPTPSFQHWLSLLMSRIPPPTQLLQLGSSTYQTQTSPSPSSITTTSRNVQSANVASSVQVLCGSAKGYQATF